MILFIGQVGEQPARPRGVPGGRLPADVRPGHARLRQVGRRDRTTPTALPEYVGARLPRRDAGAARAGRARAARGHAARRRPAPVLPRIEPALAAPRAGGAGAACASCSLPPSGRSSSSAAAAGRRPRAQALERFAERWQLPVGCAFRFQDVFDNRHPNYAGDVGIGINPKLAARVARCRPDRSRSAPRLGEMTTGGYELLVPPQAAPAARPRPRRRRGARPRLRAPTCAINASMACAAPALATLDAAGDVRWARLDRTRRTPTTKPISSRRRSRRSTWPRSCARSIATSPTTRSSPTAPATSAAGCIASIATPACATPAAAQLAPTSGAMGYGVPAAVAAALLEPHRTVVNLAGDGDFLMNGAGARDRDRARRRQGVASSSASSSTTAATGRSACTRSASTRAASRAPTSATPTSPRSLAPTAGGRASASTRRRRSSRRCARRSPPGGRR